MQNQNGSQPTPTSSGVIAPDWLELQQRLVSEGHPSERDVQAAKMIFYGAYLCCYNRIMESLRQPPAYAALITATIRDELIKFHNEIT